MLDPTTLTDAELHEQLDILRAEEHRRRTLTSALVAAPELAKAYQQSLGREEGEEFVKPLGAHDAYPLGWKVMYGGKEWEALREGAHLVPGESGDWREVLEEGVIPDWIRPTGAHDSWPAGAIVKHEGRTWRNDHPDNNAWEPGTLHSQWTDITEGEDQ